MNKKIFNIIAVIAISIICFALTPITFQNDTFYTIKIGEHILNSGIDMQDSFSWHKDIPYTYPHWAYDLITYLIFSQYNFTGVYIFTAILAIVLGITMYLINLKINKNHIVSLIVTIVIMIMFKTYIAARAQLITFILFILTILCIEKFLETKKIIYGVILVLIPIIIANVHLAVWPFYFILFLPYIVEYMIAIIYTKYVDIDSNNSKIIIEKNSNIRWLFLIILIAVLTGLFTPLGTTPYTYLIKTLIGTTTKSIAEHTPLILMYKKEIIVMFLIFIAILTFSKVKIRMSDLCMFSGLSILAIASSRQVSMLLLIGSIIITKTIYNLINIYVKQNWEQEILNVFRTKIICVLFIILSILIGIALFIGQKNDKFIDETLYPVNASKWINENLDIESIRLYNEYNYGSYLLFEGIPVFIDSRADLYTPEFNGQKDENGKYIGKNIFDDFIQIYGFKTYYQDKFDEYGITHVILQTNSKLNMLISRDDNYEQIYLDDAFVIYEFKQ